MNLNKRARALVCVNVCVRQQMNNNSTKIIPRRLAMRGAHRRETHTNTHTYIKQKDIISRKNEQPEQAKTTEKNAGKTVNIHNTNRHNLVINIFNIINLDVVMNGGLCNRHI